MSLIANMPEQVPPDE